jgi:hypothetical protein
MIRTVLYTNPSLSLSVTAEKQKNEGRKEGIFWRNREERDTVGETRSDLGMKVLAEAEAEGTESLSLSHTVLPCSALLSFCVTLLLLC